MKTKKGAGGKQQAYDSKGRYVKSNLNDIINDFLIKNDTKLDKMEQKRQELFNKAINSTDKYLYEVYKEIAKDFPDEIKEINLTVFDKNIMAPREFDIYGKHCIIEIKSGNVGKCMKQFLAQKKFAEHRNLKFYVFAPQINQMRKKVYTDVGIDISTTINELKDKIRRSK